MILYYSTKFHFNAVNSFRVIGRGHFPPFPAQAPKKARAGRVKGKKPYTVEPLLSGHPRGIGNWPLNRGWPLNKGSSGIKFWLRENVNLFKYKHALSFLTIVTCNTAITLSSKNRTNPVKNILDKVSTRTI